MFEENFTTTASSSRRSRPYLKRQSKNSEDGALIKTSKKLQKRSLKAAESEDDGDSKTMSITDLPNEILGKILNQVSFDDLFNLEIVCKRLQKVVKGVVWRMKDSFNHESIIKYTKYPRIPSNFKESINVKRHKITIKSVEAILSRANNIKCIDLSIYSLTLNQEVCSLLSMVPNLITLNLSFISLKKADLVTIAHLCPMLEEISLECCFSLKEKSVFSLRTLCKKCPNIKYMNLAMNKIGKLFDFLPIGLLYLNLEYSNFTSNDMNILAQRVPNLETLILNSFKPKINMNIWLSKLTKLRFLQIDTIYPGTAIPPLDFSYLHELEKLRVGTNYLVKISTLESLQNCAKLKSLDLRYNYPLGRNSEAFNILKKCPALKYCDLSEWPNLNDGLIDFVQHNQIEYIKINNCDNLTKNLIKSLINDCESLNYLVMWSRYTNYSEILSSIFSETRTPPRKNTLKIIVQRDTKLTSFTSSCKWCKVIPLKGSDPCPFPNFTSVKIPCLKK